MERHDRAWYAGGATEGGVMGGGWFVVRGWWFVVGGWLDET